jgi:hypothetical protein
MHDAIPRIPSEGPLAIDCVVIATVLPQALVYVRYQYDRFTPDLRCEFWVPDMLIAFPPISSGYSHIPHHPAVPVHGSKVRTTVSGASAANT